MRMPNVALVAVVVATLCSTAWADPGRDESGHYGSDRYERYKAYREADREAWKRDLERRREAAKARREYERETTKAWAEMEREERKHYEEMRREARKHRDERHRERFERYEELRLEVGPAVIVYYEDYPYAY